VLVPTDTENLEPLNLNTRTQKSVVNWSVQFSVCVFSRLHARRWHGPYARIPERPQSVQCMGDADRPACVPARPRAFDQTCRSDMTNPFRRGAVRARSRTGRRRHTSGRPPPAARSTERPSCFRESELHQGALKDKGDAGRNTRCCGGT
jgi:hypothetical protein